jgi:uncharacterized protein
MIFVDSNIPMYLVGAPHPNKDAALRALNALIEAGERLVSDVEVLQEILHRYTAIDRRDAIQPAFDALLGIVDELYAVDLADIQRAKQQLLRTNSLSARDALHLAVMQRHGITRILSFDRGFDVVSGVERLG